MTARKPTDRPLLADLTPAATGPHSAGEKAVTGRLAPTEAELIVAYLEAAIDKHADRLIKRLVEAGYGKAAPR